MPIAIDIARVRAETPACANLLHFNNAGASLQPLAVQRAVFDHLTLENTIGGYEAAAAASVALDDFYTAFAELLGANREDIACMENATRAWDMAFHALPLVAGDRVITHESEYASNVLGLLQTARRRGIVVDVVRSDASGQIDLDALTAAITPRTRLIAITWVPSQGGLVNPAAAVGRIAREHGLLYLLDACQAVGQMAIDVKAIGCDILTGTGRKFLRGPRGTGFLYLRRDLARTLEPPFIELLAADWTSPDTYTLRDDTRRFETWDGHVAGKIGLRTAVRYALEIGLDAIEARVVALAALLRDRLASMPGVRVHDRGDRRCGIVTFTRDGESSFAILQRMRARGINVSVADRGVAQIDFGARGLDAVARASVHYYNTEEEVEVFCGALGEEAARSRGGY